MTVAKVVIANVMNLMNNVVCYYLMILLIILDSYFFLLKQVCQRPDEFVVKIDD